MHFADFIVNITQMLTEIEQARKEAWFLEFQEFMAKANANGWAADGIETNPNAPDSKR